MLPSPRVLVTRAEGDQDDVVALLADAGCTPVLAPMIARFVDAEAVRAGLAACPTPDVLLLTSPAAARGLAGALPAGFSPGRIACVGPVTAEATAEVGLRADVVPEQATGAETVRALGDLAGRTVLHVAAARPVPTTREALERAGARLVSVVAYTTLPHPDRRRHAAAAGPVALVTLTAPSIARAWSEARVGTAAADAPVVAIGPSTAGVARALGLSVVAVADVHTAEGLVAAVVGVLRPA